MPTVTTATRRQARSNADWDALTKDVIVPRLQAGEKMTAVRAARSCPRLSKLT